MSRKSIILLLIFLIPSVVIYHLWPSDESRIKKLVKQTAVAFETENTGAVMSVISFNYTDNYNLSYLLLKKNLERRFKTFSAIKVEYENLKIEASADLPGRATVWMDVRVIATQGETTGYFIGDFNEPARFILELEKNPAKKWLIVRSSYDFGY